MHGRAGVVLQPRSRGARVAFRNEQVYREFARAVAITIAAEAAKHTCGDCVFSVFGDQCGECRQFLSTITGKPLLILRKNAAGCREWKAHS